MKIRKAFSAMALTALLAIPLFGFTNNSSNAHAAIIHARGYKRVSLPYSYRGTWGAQRSNTVIGAGAQKNPAAAKFYKRSGYFENRGINTRHAFAKSHAFKGYASLFMNKHKWGEMQGGVGFVLDKKDHALDYIVGNENWNLHRISNRTYNLMLRQARSKKRRWRKVRYYKTGYRDHYGHWHAYRRHARKSHNRNVNRKRSNKNSGRESLPEFRAQTLNLINQDRADSTDKAPLQENSDLDQIAQIRAKQASSPSQMNQSDPHMDPATGKSYYEEVGNQLGYDVNAFGSDNHSASGENLAWGDTTPKDFNNAWYTKEKPYDGGHYQNIVGDTSTTGHYNLVGIGVYHNTGAEVFADNVSSNN